MRKEVSIVVLGILLGAVVVPAQPSAQEVEDATGIPGATALPDTGAWSAKLYALCADLCAMIDDPSLFVPGNIVMDGLLDMKFRKPSTLFVLIPDEARTEGVTVTGNVIPGFNLILGFTQKRWCSFGGSSGGPGTIQRNLALLWLQEACDELDRARDMHRAALAACP